MVKNQKQEESAIHKTITIFPKQNRFIEDRSINLSKFVQKKLDEEIEATDWKDR